MESPVVWIGKRRFKLRKMLWSSLMEYFLENLTKILIINIFLRRKAWSSLINKQKIEENHESINIVGTYSSIQTFKST